MIKTQTKNPLEQDDKGAAKKPPKQDDTRNPLKYDDKELVPLKHGNKWPKSSKAGCKG